MDLFFSKSKRIIDADGHAIRAWSEVRNELNGRRPKPGIDPDICHSILSSGQKGPPTMPRPFPNGTFRITGIVPHVDPKDHYLYPFFIATDATDELDEWLLDKQGRYLRPSGKKITVGALGLHFSSSNTTMGCIRIGKEADLRWLVELVSRGNHRLIVTD